MEENIVNLKLQELVTNKRQILLQIIKLISEEDRWYSIQEISVAIQLVERSVQRYVNDLYDVVNDCNEQKNDHFCLQMKKNKGIKLIIEQKENAAVLKKFIYESDETIQILMALLFESYHSTFDYSKKEDLGSHTIMNSLNKIKTFLQPLNLTVSTRDFCIVGSEAQLRIISNSIAWYLFNSDTWPNIFHQVDQSKIDSAIITMSDSLHLDIPPIQKREFTYMVIINILRYRKGKSIDFLSEWEQYVPVDNQCELYRIIESMYKSFHIYSHSEVRFVLLNLMTKSFIYDVSYLKKEIMANLLKNSADVLTTTDLFMKEFDQFYPIPLKDYDDIYFYILRGHLAGKIYKQADFNFSGHSLKNDIPLEFATYYTRASRFINKLWSISHDDFFLEVDYLIELYFLVLSFTELTSLFEQTVTLSLESDLPEICEKHIEEFICNQFKHYFNVVFTKDKMLQRPDLILTNIALNTQKSTPSLVIDYPISDRTMLEIKEVLCNFNDRKKKRSNLIINIV